MTTPEMVERVDDRKIDTPQEIVDIGKEVDVPDSLRRIGIKQTPSDLSSVIADSNNRVSDDSRTPITITLPQDPQQIQVASHGDPANASTWSANYWIRRIRKALFYGWRIVTGGKSPVELPKV